MALSIIGVTSGQQVRAAHVSQFYDLLTGVMTDQPVTLKNVLRVGGNQGVGAVPFRVDGVALQTAKMLELYTLAADTQPAFSIDKAGLHSWGPGGGSAIDLTLGRSGVGILQLLGSGGSPGAMEFGSVSYIDGTDPAAPGAGKIITYSKSGGLYFRAGASGPVTQYASWVKLDEKVLGASAATMDFTSIPATYRHLRLEIYARTDDAASARNVLLQFNGDTAANYDWEYLVATGAAAVSGNESIGSTSIFAAQIPGAGSLNANLFGSATIDLLHYANAANNKTLSSQSAVKIGTASGNVQLYNISGFWRSNAAINRILLSTTGNFVSGTVATLYGLA